MRPQIYQRWAGGGRCAKLGLQLGMVLLLVAVCMRAQAGGAGGAGTGAGGSGAGAGAAGPAGAQGAGIQGAGVQGKGQAAQSAAQNGLAPQQYAVGASGVVDLRKPSEPKPNALNIQQVMDAAKAKNPTLLSAAATLRGVRAQERQAAVRANPYFTLYGTNVTLPGDGSEGNPYAYSAQVSRLFERGEKRLIRMQGAKANTAQAAAQTEETIRQTLFQVKSAFTNMVIAKQALLLSQASLADFRHEVEIARDRYQAGDLGKLDYERLDLQLGSLESDEANNIVAVQQASTKLQTLMGQDTVKPDFDVTGEVVPPTSAKTKEELVAGALTMRPDYRAAQSGLLASEANARLAVANGTTDPTLEAEYDRSGNYNSAGFSVNIPLRLFDKNQGNKETTRYQADAARFTEAAARNQVVSDVEQAWIGYEQSKRLSDRFTQHYLDESQDVLQIAQFAYEHGGIALIDYLDALRDARSTTSNALNAYQNTWLALHQLGTAAAAEVLP